MFEFIASSRPDVDAGIQFGTKINTNPNTVMFQITNHQSNLLNTWIAEEEAKRSRAHAAAAVNDGVHSTATATTDQKDIYTKMGPLLYLFDSTDDYHHKVNTDTGGPIPTERAHAREINLHAVETRLNLLLRSTIDRGLASNGLQLNKNEVMSLMTLEIGPAKGHVASDFFKKHAAKDADVPNREINVRVLAALLGDVFSPFVETAINDLPRNICEVHKPRTAAEFTMFLDEYIGRVPTAPAIAQVSRAAFRAWVTQTLTVQKSDPVIEAYRSDKIQAATEAQELEIQQLQELAGHASNKRHFADDREPNDNYANELATHTADRPFPLPDGTIDKQAHTPTFFYSQWSQSKLSKT